MAAGLAVAGAAAVAFGVQSVRAFAEAEEAQNRLAFALEKFPALADTNVQALQRLNSALMMKTRFDDDAIASGQAVLAQFGLTGRQLEQLTPLLLDYAAATGEDMTTSAENLGRALLGQGRALRVLGIDFQDAGSVAANFDQLVQDLSSSVGGFAERDAQTAAGQLQILQNRFGEVQEAVGEALLPALQRLIDWIDGDGLAVLERFADWFAEDGVDAITGFVDVISQLAENGKLVPSIVGGITAIALAQVGLNAAMLANPVGLFVVALGVLAAQIAYVTAFWEDFKWSASDDGWTTALRVMFTGWVGLIATFAQNWDMIWYGLQRNFTQQINGMISAINFLLAPLQTVLDVINRIAGTRLSVRIAPLAMPSVPFQGSASFAAPAQRVGVTAFAEGGIVRATPGGTLGVIGEAGDDEAVIPLSSPTARRLLGGGGPEINVYVNGWVGGSRSDFAKATVRAIQDAVKLGDVPRGALA
jgi:hypothetical protein